jgi:hypothetical protein
MLRERDDTRRLTCARGHDVVEQVPDERGVDDRDAPGTAITSEQRAPAHRAHQCLGDKRGEARNQPPGVAVLDRAPCSAPLHALDGEIGENDGQRKRDDDRERAAAWSPSSRWLRSGSRQRAFLLHLNTHGSEPTGLIGLRRGGC